MKYNIGIALSAILSLCCSVLFAQNNFSILHLKNGGVYIGEILNDRSQNVEMRLSDGNEISFPKGNVKRHLQSHRIKVYPDGKYNVIQGYFFQFGSGSNAQGIFQDAESTRISSHLPFIFGTYLNPRWGIGGGFGFEFNEAEVSGFEFDTQVFSNFIYGRYYLTENKRRPFAYARVGYGFRGDDSEFDAGNNGGFNFQAGGGFHFTSRRKGKFVLTLGYHLQETDGTERFIDQFGGEIIADYDILIRRMVLTFAAEMNKIPKGYRGEKRLF